MKNTFIKKLVFNLFLLAFLCLPLVAQDEYITTCTGTYNYNFFYPDEGGSPHYTVETVSGDVNWNWQESYSNPVLTMTVTWGKNGNYYTGGVYNVRYWTEDWIGKTVYSYEYRVTVLQENYINNTNVTDVTKVMKATNSVLLQSGFHYKAVSAGYDLQGYLMDCQGNKLSVSSQMKSENETKTYEASVKTTHITTAAPKDVIISPNPVTDVLRIYIPNNEVSYDISVFNANGKLLYQGKQQGESNNINFSNFPKGLYFVKITGGDGSFYNKKIMKE